MSILGNSLFLHANTSLWSLAPVAILILTPTTWWGWALKVLSLLWLIGSVIALTKIDRGDDQIFGKRTGGYLLSIPFFAAVLWLEPGWLRTIGVVIFVFLNISSFFIIRRAVQQTFSSKPSETN
jgi:hypothetical protein